MTAYIRSTPTEAFTPSATKHGATAVVVAPNPQTGGQANENGMTISGVKQAGAARIIHYSVSTKGVVKGDKSQFAALAQETLADVRGWSRSGVVAFEQVASGGDFTLVLSEAKLVSSFSPTCSVSYSCRVGENVIINDDRWMHGSRLPIALREYRHLVINHEVGHFLGFDDARCSARGQLANVMQQQSKGGAFLGACTPNAWPREEEVNQL